MLNWRLSRSYIPAREACLGRIHQRITSAPHRISTPRRNTSTSSQTEISPSPSSSSSISNSLPYSQSPPLPQSSQWQENTSSSEQQTPDPLPSKPNKKQQHRPRIRTTTPIRAPRNADEAPDGNDDGQLRLVPGYLLRPTKPGLLRYAMTNSLRERGVPKSEQDIQMEEQLERAFQQPILDSNYAHRDVEELDIPNRDIRNLNKVSLREAIQNAQTFEQLHDLLATRIKYDSQRKELVQSWSILDDKAHQIMNDIHSAIDFANPQSISFGETRKLELLMLINSAIACLNPKNLNRSDAEVRKGYLISMKLAASVFSPQALASSMALWKEQKPATMKLRNAFTYTIILRLLNRYDQLQWQGQVDHSQDEIMLEVLTGLNAAGERISDIVPGNSHVDLFNLAQWARDTTGIRALGEFAKLLGLLGNTTILHEARPILKEKTESEIPQVQKIAKDAAKLCVEACLKTGDYDLGIAFAEMLMGNTRLEQHLSKRLLLTLLLHDKDMILHKLIKARNGEDQFLHKQLQSVERRLCITWDNKKHQHIFAKGVGMWSDQDKSLVGAETERLRPQIAKLLEEVAYYGSSSSLDELAQLADTLNDVDGLCVSLGKSFIRYTRGQAIEFAWFPQLSPIEFSQPSPPTLPSIYGLLRTRPLPGKGLSHVDRTRHLIQVGYIGARKRSNKESQTLPKYTPTGHIVAWDRNEHVFVVMYVGKSYGTISPGAVPEIDQFENPLPFVMSDVDLLAMVRRPIEGKDEPELYQVMAKVDEKVDDRRRWEVDVDVCELS